MQELDRKKIKEAGLKAERDALQHDLGERREIVRDSGLKLDDEQTNFLLYYATRAQFNETIEHLKQRQ